MKSKVLQQLIRMTRLTLYGIFIQALLSSMLFAEDSEAQIKSLNEIYVTLQFSESKVENVFDEIENQTNLNFAYHQRELENAPLINLSIIDQTLGDALLQISAQSRLKFKRIDETIHVSKIKKSEEKTDEVVEFFQVINVTGKITSEEEPDGLPGVNILVKGTTEGTVTDIDGNYSIEVPSSESILVFSSVGFTTQEVTVGNNSVIDLVMQPDVTSLEEVVVVGYGTQKKGDVTSSIASVKEDEFLTGNILDAGQLIQGKVAGLSISTPSGDPTSSTQIVLRGRTTLLGQNVNPLILIDGVPGDLKTVAPQDIESVDVLKDGSAAAIYGTRGTNGVILITTRRAKGTEKSTVEYSGYVSTQTIARQLDISTTDNYREQIAAGHRDASWDLGDDTDWMKEITQTPISQLHNLTFRGGNAQTNYLVNLNYNDAEGIFKKSDNESFTGRMDFNHSMFDDKVDINLNILSSTSKYTTTADGSSFSGYTYRQAIIRNPTSPIKDEEGNWFEQPSIFEYENPLARLYESDGRNNYQNTRFGGNISYMPINGLKLSGLFAYTKWNENRGYSETKQHISTLRDGRNGYASVGAEQSIDRLMELTGQYEKFIGDHSFMILGGYSYQDNEFIETWMQNWDFPTDQFGYSNIQSGNALKDGLAPEYSYRAKTNLIGFFGRITYNYKDRYLLLASLRHEGASQLLGTEDPWGTFPAVSAGWRITEESFMQDQDIFENIKLRVGYGVTGSQPSDLFLGVGLLDYDRYIFSDGEWIQTLSPSQNENPYLRWEEKHETNIGLDFSMLDNRLGGSIDYYVRTIDGLLYDYAVPSPPNLYNSTRANVGKMENKGVEIMINIIPIRNNDFEWSADINFSTNRNELVSLSNELYQASSDYFTTGYTGPPVQTFTHIVKVGEPIGNFYGFKVIDIGNDPEDAANYGQWVYEGRDGERVNYSDFPHSFEDKKVIGNGLPKYYAGCNFNFRYKNLDLSITQRGAFGFQVANLTRMMYENPTFEQYNLLKSAYDEVYGKTLLQSPHEFNSYYIEDGDYWKIDNITLGYNFRNVSLKHIQSARIYISTLNTFTFTGYKGIDPEVTLINQSLGAQGGTNINTAAGLAPGIDNRDKYPTTRTYTLGVNLTF